MKIFSPLWLLVLLVSGSVFLAGCGGQSSPPTKPRSEQKDGGGADLLKQACEIFHQARDLSHFRDALNLVNVSLDRSPVRPHFQLPSEEREQLPKMLGLTDDELEEIEAASFRPMDVHHLEACYLLRDAAHALADNEQSPLEQVEECFRWAMRHVALFEGEENFVPPQFILRRGLGTAMERGLLFLALAHQFNWPGFVVTWSDSSSSFPQRWVGVLIEGEKADLYLFDPRLGRPVRGPGGKGIATLAQVRQQPQLLLPHWPQDKGPPQLELALVLPLSALAPRLKYLEDLLIGQDRVRVAWEPKNLLERLRTAGLEDLRPWGGQAEAKEKPANAPVRALRLFLQPEEGGIDKTQRFQKYKMQLIPWFVLWRQYNQMKLAGDLAAPARDFLLKTTEDLFQRYALAPRDFLIRGQPEQAVKRLDRMRTVLDDLDFASVDEKEFQRRIADWRERLNHAHLAVTRKENGAQNQFNAMLYEDQFLFNLTQESEEGGQGKFVKKMPTFIVGTAVREPLGQAVLYLLAMCWQERAERREAYAASLKSGHSERDKERKVALKEARAAWFNTQKSWGRFLERHGLTPPRQDVRVGQILERFDAGDFVNGVHLWQQLFEDYYITFHARLLLAHAQDHTGQAKQARATLQKLADDLAAVENKTGLTHSLTQCLTKPHNQLPPPLRAHLELLQRNLGPGGTLAALKETVQGRLRLNQ